METGTRNVGTRTGMRMAVRPMSHADRLADFVRSLSRRSPYASSLACIRLKASPHRLSGIQSAMHLMRASSHQLPGIQDAIHPIESKLSSAARQPVCAWLIASRKIKILSQQKQEICWDRIE